MKKAPIFLLLFYTLSVFPLAAQSPYTFSAGRDGSLVGAGLLTLGISYPLSKKVTSPTLAEIENLNIDDIPRIDRWSVRQHSLTAKKLSDGFLFGSYLLPATMLAGEASRKDFGSGGLLALEALILNNGITGLTKVLAKRKRPFLYGSHFKQYKWENSTSRMSFFSGHSSNTACMSFLTAQLFNDYYPDSKAMPWVWSAAIAIPAFTAYNRMRAGKHFFTDVLTGYVVGAAVGILVPKIHQM